MYVFEISQQFIIHSFHCRYLRYVYIVCISLTNDLLMLFEYFVDKFYYTLFIYMYNCVSILEYCLKVVAWLSIETHTHTHHYTHRHRRRHTHCSHRTFFGAWLFRVCISCLKCANLFYVRSFFGNLYTI